MTAGRTNHALFASAPREHVRLVHVDCQRMHCSICDGGLFVCTVCGQAEAELEAQCPGPEAQPPTPDRSRFITGNETPCDVPGQCAALNRRCDACDPLPGGCECNAVTDRECVFCADQRAWGRP